MKTNGEVQSFIIKMRTGPVFIFFHATETLIPRGDEATCINAGFEEN